MTELKKVLITGAAGRIGTIVREHLEGAYEFCGIDRRAPADDSACSVADLSDLEAIQPAFEGVDTVVHLGADPSPRASWESVLGNNIVATRNVYEAARLAGAARVIFASTNHACGFCPLKDDPYKAVYDGRLGEVRQPIPPLGAEVIRPDSLYGVSKTFGESLGSYYHDAFGLSVICLRIGWVMTPDDPTFSPPALSLWLSHRDAAQLIKRSIDASPAVGFAIVNGESANVLAIHDPEPARRILGYEPQDGAGDTWTPRPDSPPII